MDVNRDALSSASSPASISDISKIKGGVEKQILSRLLVFSKEHISIFQYEMDSHIVNVDSEIDTSIMYVVEVLFLNRIKLKINYRGVTSVSKIISAVIEHLKFKVDSSYFTLSFLEDSEYYFIEKNSCLHKVLPIEVKTLHLKVLFFPTNIDKMQPSLLQAIYMQVRADVIDERLRCSHDDALGICSLALQCEVGDYKADFGLNYYNIEEYTCKHIIEQLGISYVRSQASVMHRQLAGIGQNDAKIMFLRRCQNLPEYGMHLHRLYKVKPCKTENSIWLGVGPPGLTLFEIKRHRMRTIQQVYKWKVLKKVCYKNKKVILVIQEPELKLKFYQISHTRAKYMVQLIKETHSYYLKETPVNKFSSLALFDDITKLSSPSLGGGGGGTGGALSHYSDSRLMSNTFDTNSSMKDISSLSSFSSSVCSNSESM